MASRPERVTTNQPQTRRDAFPEIVRHCRESHGDTLREFAERFDGIVNHTTIGVWERGGVRDIPRRNAILRISELCGVPPGKLLDALGYWGSDGPGPDITTPADPLLADLLTAARELPPHQLRALIDVARAMRRD